MVWDSFITREQGRWREITHLAVHCNNKQENNLISHPQNNSRNFTFSLYYLFPTSTLLLHSASPGYLQKFTLPLSLAFSLSATDWSNGRFFWTKKQQGDLTTTFCQLTVHGARFVCFQKRTKKWVIFLKHSRDTERGRGNKKRKGLKHCQLKSSKLHLVEKGCKITYIQILV